MEKRRTEVPWGWPFKGGLLWPAFAHLVHTRRGTRSPAHMDWPPQLSPPHHPRKPISNSLACSRGQSQPCWDLEVHVPPPTTILTISSTQSPQCFHFLLSSFSLSFIHSLVHLFVHSSKPPSASSYVSLLSGFLLPRFPSIQSRPVPQLQACAHV